LYLDRIAGADISDPFLDHDDIFAEQTAPAARRRPLRAVTIRHKKTFLRRIVQALALAGVRSCPMAWCKSARIDYALGGLAGSFSRP
jgi:hypothetical protein